jgi:uncharacterized protein (UPF0332 family)
MNDNVKNLLQMSKDCLEDAQILFEKQRFEGTANRSYYAYFDAVRALLAGENRIREHTQNMQRYL